MSNPIARFIAAQSSKPPAAPARPAETNPVTREEFDTLVKAATMLIEEIDGISDPAKLRAVLTEALAPLKQEIANARAGRQPLALKPDRGFLAPPADDDAPLRVNAGPADHRGRRPLALPADRAYLAPKGD